MSYSCTTCAGEAGDTTHEGIFVHAGFGSRYDANSYVWLIRGNELPKPGILCDTCLEQHVEAGRLEIIHSQFSASPERLSEAAYRELFAYGARRSYHDLWEQMAGSQYHPCEETDDLDDRVILTRKIINPTPTSAVEVGRAHAAAVFALRAPDNDPGFDRAAWRWAAERVAKEAQHDMEMPLDEEALLAAFEALAKGTDD